MPEIKLKPVKGRDVPLEDGRDWPTDDRGKPTITIVEDSLYYRRRRGDGDVTIAPDDERAAVETDVPGASGASAAAGPSTNASDGAPTVKSHGGPAKPGAQ